MRVESQCILVVVAAGLVGLAGCADEEYPASLWAAQHPPPPSVDGSTAPVDAGEVMTAQASGPHTCAQAHATSLPARLVAMNPNAMGGGTVVLPDDLFARFDSVCGNCHGSIAAMGGFQVQTLSDFETSMTETVIARVLSNGPPADPSDFPMPPLGTPTGKPYSQRDASDPVREFADLTKQWLDQNKPPSFTPSSSAGSADSGADEGGAPAASLVMTPFVGNTMTNVGNCIPSKWLFGIERTKSAELDAMFAAASAAAPGPDVTAQQQIGLPRYLSQTDLLTLDSAVLAQYGVVAYAPAYPLWSDNAGKLRYVRVPRGTSIHFDKATQRFEIPPNTRFYKTFMKPVVDTDGRIRYRKIETRLIVARPDGVDAHGNATQTALFGTYRWNDDETDAELVTTPLRSGAPFADTLIQYTTDEDLAQRVLSTNPLQPETQLLNYRAARHYAIPSSERCVQCHMGSATASFSLGFLPVQIARRPVGEGGTIEDTGPDELTQLQRFIDYGIITGIESPADVLPLEESEGMRAPRNDYELRAQGYMLGNCSHCHNPRGNPSVDNPVLKDVLDFLPSPTGGIFQFPLERYSPRIFRGLSGDTPIPYITPSLMDLPRTKDGAWADDLFVQSGGGQTVTFAAYAPWRSLIYRNVENQFAYTDDYSLFPHMPMNTPGYDPRAKQILSDWMVSIPAVRKSPDIAEYAFVGQAGIIGGDAVDANSQPYVEVRPGDPRYAAAVAAAQTRLDVLHGWTNAAVPNDPDQIAYCRYDDPGSTDDIVDPAVLANPVCRPVPVAQTIDNNVVPVPGHPHWVVTDQSQPPGDWGPRRADWASIIVEKHSPPPDVSCGAPSAAQVAADADQLTAIDLLQSVTLADVRSYATAPVPFGLWQKKSGCDFSSQPTVSQLEASPQPPSWLGHTTGVFPDDPVYEQTPGQAVYKMICINCHGPNGSANGRMARNLATMTGGLAQVADFRDGLFGPVGATGDASNVHRVFGAAALPSDAPASWTSVGDDDRAARYMAWMALGGTSVRIPEGVLQVVAVTQVLDQHRVVAGNHASANMLSTAKSLCASLIGRINYEPDGFDPKDVIAFDTSVIQKNGDADLWLHLCAMNNPPPIRVVTMIDKSLKLANPAFNDDGTQAWGPSDIAVPESYPANTPVGTDKGEVEPSLTSDNLWPWCVQGTGDDLAAAKAQNLPICPAGLTGWARDEGDRWTVHGAINAGLSVFLYLKDLESHSPAPDYNQCELLP